MAKQSVGVLFWLIAVLGAFVSLGVGGRYGVLAAAAILALAALAEGLTRAGVYQRRK